MATAVFDVGKKNPPGGDRKQSQFNMRVEREWLDRVERQANRFGLTVAAYIRMSASQQLERDESTDPTLRD